MPSTRRIKAAAVPAPRLDDVLGYQLARASIRTHDVFFEVAGVPLDVRPVEYTILSLIGENPDLSAARLAQLLAVTAPNITAWLGKLEKRGLVMRVASETDRRAQVLSLTPAGSQLAADATQRLVEAERATFSTLSHGEYVLLGELLRKLAT